MTHGLVRTVLFAACVHAYALPKVVIFSTGGTISGKHDPARGGYVPALSGSELVAAVPKLKEIADIQVEQVAAINSGDMTPEIWLKLANGVQRVLDDAAVSGVGHSRNQHAGRNSILSRSGHPKREACDFGRRAKAGL